MHSQHTYNRNHNRNHSRQHCCHRNSLSHPFHISRTKSLRSHHRKTGSQSNQTCNDQKHNRSRRSDCRQCFCSNKLSNYDRIRHTVKLLKYVAQKDWNRKIKNHFCRISYRHISFHQYYPLVNSSLHKLSAASITLSIS